MLSKPMIMVLGAGASGDFGLPVGSALATSLRGALSLFSDPGVPSGDRRILDSHRATGVDQDVFIKAANEIASALPDFKSIDDCLHTHATNQLGVLAAKMAIAAAIADAEARSSIAPLWSNDRQIADPAREGLRAQWVGALARTLFTGLPRERYRDAFHDLKIISFNYDRCVESALYKLIQSALNISPAQATEAMAGLKVFHPYGSLGPLRLHDEEGTPYAPPDLNLLEAAKGLYVYTEPRDQPGDLRQMKDAVYEATRVAFLGFGFHKQNLEILGISGAQPRGKEVFATVFREPFPAIEIYRQRIAQHIGLSASPHLENEDCSQFMHDFGAVFGM